MAWTSGEKEQAISASQSITDVDWDLAEYQSPIDLPGCGYNRVVVKIVTK